MVAEDEIAYREVDTDALRKALRKQNAKVDWDQEIKPTPWSVETNSKSN